MNIQKAQDELYKLSEEYGIVRDKIEALQLTADAIMVKRRELLHRYPVLDLRRIGDRERMVWSASEIAYWGEGCS